MPLNGKRRWSNNGETTQPHTLVFTEHKPVYTMGLRKTRRTPPGGSRTRTAQHRGPSKQPRRRRYLSGPGQIVSCNHFAATAARLTPIYATLKVSFKASTPSGSSLADALAKPAFGCRTGRSVPSGSRFAPGLPITALPSMSAPTWNALPASFPAASRTVPSPQWNRS